MEKNETARQRAMSSMAYFFLRMAFGKEKYPESVMEELEWVVNELMEEHPDPDLLAAVKEEFLSGDYLTKRGIDPYFTLQQNLLAYYGYDAEETKGLKRILRGMRFNSDPLIILIGRSGTGKTSAAEYLYKKYGWIQVESYTTRPKRSADEIGHRFITEAEFDAIPEDEIKGYMEYRGYRYGATTEQLDEANMYVVDPGGYEILKQQYHDRTFYSIKLTASRAVLEERMKARGTSEKEIDDRLRKDDEIFGNFHTDAEINTDHLTISEVSQCIVKLFHDVCESRQRKLEAEYLTVHISEVKWDTSNSNMDEKCSLPEEITVSDHFRIADYKNGSEFDSEKLSNDIFDWLTQKYEVLHEGFSADITAPDGWHTFMHRYKPMKKPMRDTSQEAQEPEYLTIHISNIKWDTSDDDIDGEEDAEDLGLPEEITVSDHFRIAYYKVRDGIDAEALADDIADWLSDEYEFLHDGFSAEITAPAEFQMNFQRVL